MFGGPAPDPVVGADPDARLAARRGGRHGRRRARQQAELERGRLLRPSSSAGRERARRREADGRGQRRGDALGAAVGDRARDRRAARDRLVLGRAGVGRRAREPAHPAGDERQGGPGRARRAPGVARALEHGVRDRARRRRRPVRGRARRARVRGDEGRDGGGVRPADDDRGPGRLDPALQRPGRDLPRRGDHAARRRGAEVPDPRAERERRPLRDRAHRARRGAVPAEVRADRRRSREEAQWRHQHSPPVHGRGLREAHAARGRTGGRGRADRRPCHPRARSRSTSPATPPWPSPSGSRC